jgi:DNA-damage-inducible protein J
MLGDDNMAEQILVQFRADKALKQEVSDIYTQLGMDLPTAFRMFMVKSKQVRGLPFDAVLPEQNNKRDDFRLAFNALRDEAADIPEMSLEDINAEISAARSERKRG